MNKLKERIAELERELLILSETNRNHQIAIGNLKRQIEVANLTIDLLDHNLRSLERKYEK